MIPAILYNPQIETIVTPQMHRIPRSKRRQMMGIGPRSRRGTYPRVLLKLKPPPGEVEVKVDEDIIEGFVFRASELPTS